MRFYQKDRLRSVFNVIGKQPIIRKHIHYEILLNYIKLVKEKTMVFNQKIIEKRS